jgi:two-component system, response regulator PdtaR
MKAFRVLVVEDDTMIGILLAEMLEEMGHDVCAIEFSEAGAVRAALRCEPNMMIVDIHLEEGSGVVAVEAILRDAPIPYVFVSGDRSQVASLPPGAVFMQKPYRETDIASAMQSALAMSNGGQPPA